MTRSEPTLWRCWQCRYAVGGGPEVSRRKQSSWLAASLLLAGGSELLPTQGVHKPLPVGGAEHHAGSGHVCVRQASEPHTSTMWKRQGNVRMRCCAGRCGTAQASSTGTREWGSRADCFESTCGRQLREWGAGRCCASQEVRRAKILTYRLKTNDRLAIEAGMVPESWLSFKYLRRRAMRPQSLMSSA